MENEMTKVKKAGLIMAVLTLQVNGWAAHVTNPFDPRENMWRDTVLVAATIERVDPPGVITYKTIKTFTIQITECFRGTLATGIRLTLPYELMPIKLFIRPRGEEPSQGGYLPQVGERVLLGLRPPRSIYTKKQIDDFHQGRPLSPSVPIGWTYWTEVQVGQISLPLVCKGDEGDKAHHYLKRYTKLFASIPANPKGFLQRCAKWVQDSPPDDPVREMAQWEVIKALKTAQEEALPIILSWLEGNDPSMQQSALEGCRYVLEGGPVFSEPQQPAAQTIVAILQNALDRYVLRYQNPPHDEWLVVFAKFILAKSLGEPFLVPKAYRERLPQ